MGFCESVFYRDVSPNGLLGLEWNEWNAGEESAVIDAPLQGRIEKKQKAGLSSGPTIEN